MRMISASPQDFINIQLLLGCQTDGILRYHQIMKQASNKDELGKKIGSPKKTSNWMREITLQWDKIRSPLAKMVGKSQNVQFYYQTFRSEYWIAFEFEQTKCLHLGQKGPESSTLYFSTSFIWAKVKNYISFQVT